MLARCSATQQRQVSRRGVPDDESKLARMDGLARCDRLLDRPQRGRGEGAAHARRGRRGEQAQESADPGHHLREAPPPPKPPPPPPNPPPSSEATAAVPTVTAPPWPPMPIPSRVTKKPVRPAAGRVTARRRARTSDDAQHAAKLTSAPGTRPSTCRNTPPSTSATMNSTGQLGRGCCRKMPSPAASGPAGLAIEDTHDPVEPCRGLQEIAPPEPGVMTSAMIRAAGTFSAPSIP